MKAKSIIYVFTLLLFSCKEQVKDKIDFEEEIYNPQKHELFSTTSTTFELSNDTLNQKKLRKEVNKTVIKYTSFGEREEFWNYSNGNPLGSVVMIKYDTNNNKTTELWGAGKTTFKYDTLNNCIEKNYYYKHMKDKAYKTYLNQQDKQGKLIESKHEPNGLGGCSIIKYYYNNYGNEILQVRTNCTGTLTGFYATEYNNKNLVLGRYEVRDRKHLMRHYNALKPYLNKKNRNGTDYFEKVKAFSKKIISESKNFTERKNYTYIDTLLHSYVEYYSHDTSVIQKNVFTYNKYGAEDTVFLFKDDKKYVLINTYDFTPKNPLKVDLDGKLLFYQN